jgi:uncharacterized SAM-binding protein YcdF (DUF218 family)
VAALLLLGVWELLAWSAALWLVTSAPLSRADALIVLSGSSTYTERTRYAAELYRTGRGVRVVLTNDGLRGGWSQGEQRNLLFVEHAAAELRRDGVTSQNIEVLPGYVTNTYTEAIALRDYATMRGWRSLLIVTSGYHSRRAIWTYRRVFRGSGIEIGLDPVMPGEQTPLPAVWWLRPCGWRAVAGEYGKLIYYEWRYSRREN